MQCVRVLSSQIVCDDTPWLPAVTLQIMHAAETSRRTQRAIDGVHISRESRCDVFFGDGESLAVVLVVFRY